VNRVIQIEAALAHVRKADRVMRRVIDAVGPCTLRPERKRFSVLARAIISQQVSTAAARTIRQRLEGILTGGVLSAAAIAELNEPALRAVGLSRQKASYLIDLARKSLDGTVRLERLGRMSDHEVVTTLTQIKGIGRWTAEMFLIFSLGRLDVMPYDDLGVRSALRNLYGLDDLPAKEACLKLAEPWRPFATIGSWYCWRSLELQRNVRNKERRNPG